MSMLRGSGVALYNLTLSQATAIYQAVYGNFSGPRQQEIVASRGKVLQLLRPNQVGQMQVLASVEVCSTANRVLIHRPRFPQNSALSRRKLQRLVVCGCLDIFINGCQLC
jgi:hypothetical protein